MTTGYRIRRASSWGVLQTRRCGHRQHWRGCGSALLCKKCMEISAETAEFARLECVAENDAKFLRKMSFGGLRASPTWVYHWVNTKNKRTHRRSEDLAFFD